MFVGFHALSFAPALLDHYIFVDIEGVAVEGEQLWVESVAVGGDFEVLDLFDLLADAVLFCVDQLESLGVHSALVVAIDHLLLLAARLLLLLIGLYRLVLDASFDLSEVLLVFGSDGIYFAHIGIFALL